MWGLKRGAPIVLVFFTSIMAITTCAYVVSAGETHTIEEEIAPGEYQKIKLEELDSRGDTLTLTIARVVATGDESKPRALDYYILEGQYAKQYSHAPGYLLQEKALIYKLNSTDKIFNWEGLRSDADAQFYLMIDNYWRDGDESGDANLTSKVKISYSVEPYVPKEGSPILMVLLILIGVLIVVGALIGFILWKKSKKEALTPYMAQQEIYYVYRGMDGSVYYLNPDQFGQMSGDGSILNYEYLGYSSMIGGVPVTDGVEAYGDNNQYDLSSPQTIPVQQDRSGHMPDQAERDPYDPQIEPLQEGNVPAISPGDQMHGEPGEQNVSEEQQADQAQAEPGTGTWPMSDEAPTPTRGTPQDEGVDRLKEGAVNQNGWKAE